MQNDLQKIDNFVIFQTETGKVNVEVFFQNDSLLLTQATMDQLFEKDRTVIGKHLKNIFIDGELTKEVASANFAHTTKQLKIDFEQLIKTLRFISKHIAM